MLLLSFKLDIHLPQLSTASSVAFSGGMNVLPSIEMRLQERILLWWSAGVDAACPSLVGKPLTLQQA